MSKPAVKKTKGSVDRPPKSVEKTKSKQLKSMVSNMLKFIPKKQLTFATKKLYGFVKKGVVSVPGLLMHQEDTLLPKLQHLPKICEESTYRQCERNIAERLETFRQKIYSNPDYMQQQEIISIQTRKCYRNVPPIYFAGQLPSEAIEKLLNLSQIASRQKIYQLMDFHDEVDFNVNQQVQHKLRSFVTFVQCQNNIKQLVEYSLDKVKLTRMKNSVIKYIIFQKATKINYLRKRQEVLSKQKLYAQDLRKFKTLQDRLLHDSQLLSRGKLITSYQQYQSLHEKFKKYCCGKHLCKYFEVIHYVNLNYQDYFLKSLKSYLSEVIVLPKDQLKKIFISKHSQFQSMPTAVLSFIDESMEVDDVVLLTVKENIQREINDTFRQGMYLCSYQTDKLTESLVMLFNDYMIDFYSTLNESLRNKPQMLLDNSKSLKVVKRQACQALAKISLDKFIQILILLSEGVERMVKRCVSIIGKLLKTAVELQIEEIPQRYQIIVAYLNPILKSFAEFANDSIGDFLQIRQIKDNEMQLARKIIDACKEWEYIQSKVSKIKPQIAQFSRILAYRKSLVRRSYDSMHQKVTNQDIQKVLQEDNFQGTMVNPRLFDIVGYILDGIAFKKIQKDKERNMLSSSLLLQKRTSEMDQSSLLNDSRLSTSQSAPIHSFSIQQDRIVIADKSYKIIQSTEFLLEYILSYLENYDEFPHLREEVQDKLIEMVLIYQTKLEQLILRSKALQLPVKRIKAKAINARILSITYVQASLLYTICSEWATRIKMDVSRVQFLKIKLKALMDGLLMKFNRILEEMQLQIIQRAQDISKVISTVAENLRNCFKFVEDIIIDSKIFHKFAGGEDWQRHFEAKTKKSRDFQLLMTEFLHSISPYEPYVTYLYQKYKHLCE